MIDNKSRLVLSYLVIVFTSRLVYLVFYITKDELMLQTVSSSSDQIRSCSSLHAEPARLKEGIDGI